MVLADDAGRRDLPIWLLGQDSHRFADDARPGPSPDELTDRLLRARSPSAASSVSRRAQASLGCSCGS
jgi:hypothetical protein